MKISSPFSALRRHRGAALALAAALLAGTGLAAAGTPAVADAPVPAFDFRDCPALPAGADPTVWRCEVLVADGSMTLGGVTLPDLAPLTITHAEGPMPDGSDGQVWGGLRGGPTPVPGGLTGVPGTHVPPLLGLALRPEYGGTSDFYSDGDNLGLFTLRFRLLNPLLPHACAIGGTAPVELRLRRTGSSQWISTDPPVIAFSARADDFAVPAPTGCGPFGPLLDSRLGLPASTGDTVSYAADYTFRTYDQLTVG